MQAPHGGYSKFRANNLDASYLPTWMQEGGYNTYLSGKFLVSYGLTDAKPEGQKTNQPRGF
jgi:N-acetylglucosamine-6-sulfatase